MIEGKKLSVCRYFSEGGLLRELSKRIDKITPVEEIKKRLANSRKKVIFWKYWLQIKRII